MLAFKNPGLLMIHELFYDSPFIHIDVEADFYLFRPTVGSFLKGKLYFLLVIILFIFTSHNLLYKTYCIINNRIISDLQV